MIDNGRIGFGSRLRAAIIDAIIMLVLGLVLGLIWAASLGGGDINLGTLWAGFGGAAVVVGLVYVIFVLMEVFMGQTPGKMILGIKIKNQDGADAGTWALSIRALVKLLLSFGFWIFFIGCLFVLGVKKQAIHDMIGKTAVFKK